MDYQTYRNLKPYIYPTGLGCAIGLCISYGMYAISG